MGATVCFQERGGSDCVATFWFVRLPDDYLVDCGYGQRAENRAIELADWINHANQRPDYSGLLDELEAEGSETSRKAFVAIQDLCGLLAGLPGACCVEAGFGGQGIG